MGLTVKKLISLLHWLASSSLDYYLNHDSSNTSIVGAHDVIRNLLVVITSNWWKNLFIIPRQKYGLDREVIRDSISRQHTIPIDIVEWKTPKQWASVIWWPWLPSFEKHKVIAANRAKTNGFFAYLQMLVYSNGEEMQNTLVFVRKTGSWTLDTCRFIIRFVELHPEIDDLNKFSRRKWSFFF